jgi:hypothetical protein
MRFYDCHRIWFWRLCNVFSGGHANSVPIKRKCVVQSTMRLLYDLSLLRDRWHDNLPRASMQSFLISYLGFVFHRADADSSVSPWQRPLPFPVASSVPAACTRQRPPARPRGARQRRRPPPSTAPLAAATFGIRAPHPRVGQPAYGSHKKSNERLIPIDFASKCLFQSCKMC